MISTHLNVHSDHKPDCFSACKWPECQVTLVNQTSNMQILWHGNWNINFKNICWTFKHFVFTCCQVPPVYVLFIKPFIKGFGFWFGFSDKSRIKNNRSMQIWQSQQSHRVITGSKNYPDITGHRVARGTGNAQSLALHTGWTRVLQQTGTSVTV